MNKSYALVWNQTLGCWNVASELVKRRGKAGRSKAVLAAGVSLLGLLSQTPAFALPTGEAIVAGSASLQTSADGKQMVIDQQSNKLITQWNEFSVGTDERVSFHQPGSNSVALNRVIGTNGSDIQGRIDANGKVFLINPNGVVFGKSAQVNVGGLVASTQNINDKDFLDGNYRFAGNSMATVNNAGAIIASDGGSVALLGAQVSNTGVIQAQMGTVALGAGEDFSVNFDGNGLLNLKVNSGAVDALAHNGGLLKADGGQVLMTAKSADSLLKTVVSNQGVIEAQTLQNKSGRITLDGGDRGSVQVAGRQDASALGGQGNGGRVENRGVKVEVLSDAWIDTRADNGTTGTWTIRSNDVIVADKLSSGTSAPTVHADTLSKNLANTSVELVSSQGDLSLDASVSWSSSSKLGLTAERSKVNVKGAINSDGANAAVLLNARQGSVQLDDNIALTGAGSSLELNHGNGGYALKDGKAVTLSGNGAAFRANGESYDVVQNLDQLRKIENNMAGHYVLGNAIVGTGRFKTIGDGSTFSGALDGLGNTISDLSIYGTTGFVGLFGANEGQLSNLNLERISANGGSSSHYNTLIASLVGINNGSGSILNVKAKDVQITGASHLNTLGGLVGMNLGGTVANSSVSGQVMGDRYTYAMGGLIGDNITNVNGVAKIINSRADITLTGQMSDSFTYYGAGGLVGLNDGGHITHSSSHGTVNLYGNNLNIGGLVGHNINNGSIADSNSSASVIGGHNSLLGGLVGFNQLGAVTHSSASGQVVGNATQAIGGLIGKNTGNALFNVSASGDVSDHSSRNVGGLVGSNNGGTIVNATATSIVSGGSHANVGGLVGYNQNATISDSTASGSVIGGEGAFVGGLVGQQSAGRIDTASVKGNVTGGQDSRVGGLVGSNDSSTIANAIATNVVTADSNSNVGGLVGYSKNATITDSVASGSVIGGKNAFVGGLVGQQSTGRIDTSSAKGSATGGQDSRVGGLVGVNGGQISSSSASATVSSNYSAFLGGLVGLNTGSILLSSASGKIDFSPVHGQLYGGLIGINFGRQSLNSVSGEALKVPMIGRNFSF